VSRGLCLSVTPRLPIGQQSHVTSRYGEAQVLTQMYDNYAMDLSKTKYLYNNKLVFLFILQNYNENYWNFYGKYLSYDEGNLAMMREI